MMNKWARREADLTLLNISQHGTIWQSQRTWNQSQRFNKRTKFDAFFNIHCLTKADLYYFVDCIDAAGEDFEISAVMFLIMFWIKVSVFLTQKNNDIVKLEFHKSSTWPLAFCNLKLSMSRIDQLLF